MFLIVAIYTKENFAYPSKFSDTQNN